MAKHLIPSNATIKSIKTGDPRKRLNDGEGLYLKLFVRRPACPALNSSFSYLTAGDSHPTASRSTSDQEVNNIRLEMTTI